MTSSTTTGQQTTEGRSVRDIVEHDPDQVNEAWCRKIYRKLLQSLELQYAMQMPHRAITADTVVFHDNGEPLLLPSIVSDPDPEQAGDLTALARLIHYAITQELIPTGPLHGRGLAGYSDSLIAAVDRCMDPDPERRPQTIDALRDILGVVALGSKPLAAAFPPPFADDEMGERDVVPVELAEPMPVMEPAEPVPAAEPTQVPPPEATPMAPPAEPMQPEQPMQAAAPTQAAQPTPPPPHPDPIVEPAQASIAATTAASDAASVAQPAAEPIAPPRHTATLAPKPGLSRRQRQAMAAGGAAILLALVLAVFAEMRDAGSVDDPVLTLPPPAAGQAHSDVADPAAAPAGGTDTAPPAASASQPPYAAAPAPAGTAIPADPAALPPSAGAPLPLPLPANPANPAAVQMPPTKGSASYNLQIQPWGIVYVDGVDRGVSPPIKRLVLAPGRHTIRVANPNFNDRTLEVDTAAGDAQIVVDFSESSQ